MPTDQDYAKVALQFLDRVELKATEVSTFVAVQNWLQAKAQSAPEPVLEEESDDEKTS